MRRSFSLMFAILFLIVLSFVGIVSLKFALKSTKVISNSFLEEKADIYLNSSVNFAVLAIQKHDFKNNCLNKINLKTPDGFEINITMHYFMKNCGSCKECSEIDTNETNKSVLLYVTVLNSIFKITKTKTFFKNP